MKWSEDYLDPESERRKMLRMQIAQDRGGVLKFMAQLPRVASAGTQFNYSTGEAYIVGEILAGAIKQPVSQYLSMKIWVPCGMESDAYWQLDSPNGQEFTGSGLIVSQGVTNVLWVYKVNSGAGNYTQYYPGASYVDIVSWDLYPVEAGDPVYPALMTLNKPIMVAETGENPNDGSVAPYSGNTDQLLNIVKANFPAVFAMVIWS